jgi:phage-related protein
MDTMISNLKMFEDIEAGIDNDRMALTQELTAFTSTTTSKLFELHEERLAVATAIQQINKKLDDMERDGTSFEAEDAIRSRIAADATAEEARRRDAAAKQRHRERRSHAIAA